MFSDQFFAFIWILAYIFPDTCTCRYQLVWFHLVYFHMFLNYSNIFLKFHFDVLKMVKIMNLPTLFPYTSKEQFVDNKCYVQYYTKKYNTMCVLCTTKMHVAVVIAEIQPNIVAVIK